jgi:putative FmdB family regulatory protein
MPTYDYACTECPHTFQHFQTMTSDLLTECTECKGKLRRLIGAGAAVIFKGTGFYCTDYKKPKAGGSKTDSGSGAAGSSSSGGDSSSSGESKSSGGDSSSSSTSTSSGGDSSTSTSSGGDSSSLSSSGGSASE